jgi:membrane protein involved in colicin uptake
MRKRREVCGRWTPGEGTEHSDRAMAWAEENTKAQARREEEARAKREAEEAAKREAVLKAQQEEEEELLREQLARKGGTRGREGAKQHGRRGEGCGGSSGACAGARAPESQSVPTDVARSPPGKGAI